MAKKKKKVAKQNKLKEEKPSVRSKAKETVSHVLHQVKEPFSLLGTLKEEGMASAAMLFTLASGMASGAAKNLRMENIKPQLRELIHSLGFAFREDLERLEARLEELEQKITEREYVELQNASDEDE